MESHKDFAIIIATRNAGAHLENCLDSIREQSLLPKQVIVQDSLSTDNTICILQGYEEKFNGSLDWRSERDSGIADAWNKALLRSTGEWVLFLGSDDALAGRNVLRDASESLSLAYPPCQIAYGMVLMIDKSDKIIEVIDRTWSVEQFKSENLLTPPHQGVFTHSSYFVQWGLYDTSLRYLADYDLMLRSLLDHQPLCLPGMAITKMRVGGLSNDRRHAFALQLELTRVRARHLKICEPRLYWPILKALLISLLASVGGPGFSLFVANAYRTKMTRRGRLLY